MLSLKFRSGTRKLQNGGSLKHSMQRNDDSANFEETKAFHMQRMKHVWDFSDMTDAGFGMLVGKMVKKIQEYYQDGLLKVSQFDIDKDWFNRKDFDEYTRASVLSELLLQVTGKSDPSIKKSTAKGRSKKIEVVDPDIEEYERQNALSIASSPSPGAGRCKRKSAQSTQTDFFEGPKKIKIEDTEQDNEKHGTAEDDAYGGAPQDLFDVN